MVSKTRTRRRGGLVPTKRRVVLLACPNTQILDAAGPAEVFARAAGVLSSRNVADPGYRIELVSTGETVVTTSSGISLLSHQPMDGVKGSIDTLLVVGGPCGFACGRCEGCDVAAEKGSSGAADWVGLYGGVFVGCGGFA
jgi:transcriptional regulator GlxA family with amidase domain